MDHPRISVDPNVRFGKPVLAGRRLAVSDILGALAAGDTLETIYYEYRVSEEEVRAALAYAADKLSGPQQDLIAAE